jgi:magnesium-transporting ATPase (P-type)
VDIAKESSDIILLEQSLLVLETGVREGRREKSAAKRKIDTYVSACLGMGLGRETLTHKKLVEKVFHLAKSS